VPKWHPLGTLSIRLHKQFKLTGIITNAVAVSFLYCIYHVCGEIKSLIPLL